MGQWVNIFDPVSTLVQDDSTLCCLLMCSLGNVVPSLIYSFYGTLESVDMGYQPYDIIGEYSDTDSYKPIFEII